MRADVRTNSLGPLANNLPKKGGNTYVLASMECICDTELQP
jgi:hypothetical protein